MPSKSKAQQKFFGVVKGIQQGTGKGTGKAKKAAKNMSKKDVDDFASTKHKGLPNKVKQETKVRALIRKMVRETFDENITEAKRRQLQIPIKDKLKVDKILKKLRLKIGKDYDVGAGKGASFMLDVNQKFLDKALDMFIVNRIRVREEKVNEDFAGTLKKEDRKKFDKKRQKQSEVLGYKLTGKSDVKTEIDNATIKEGFQKRHFLNLIKKEIDSLKGQIAYAKDKVRYKGTPDWEKKEFKAVLKDTMKNLKDTEKHYKRVEKLSEAKKRDYKAEYKKFQSSTKSKKYRAELNKYNRQKGTYGNGDGKDASHKGGKIVGFEKESVNRGRKEKSRLKKEAISLGGAYEKMLQKQNDKTAQNALSLVRNKIMKDYKIGKVYRGTKVTRKLVATLINNGMKELRNKAKSPGLKNAFQKIIDIREKNLKNMKEGKLTEKIVKSDPKVWVPDKFDKYMNKLPISKIRKLKEWEVIKIGEKFGIKDWYDTLKWVSYNFDIDYGLNEGKLTEAKETIFDVAARVMKDKSMHIYKSSRGKVKVDMQTANLLTKVFKKVNPKMKKYLSKLGNDNPAQLVQTLWAVVK